MKKTILAVLMIGLMTTVRAQEQSINLKYLAQFTCNEYLLNNFLSKETFNLKQCKEGFLSVYQEQETDYMNENGPLLAKVIGVNLVGSLAEYNGCSVKDYCSVATKQVSDLRQTLFVDDYMIEQCVAGFEFSLNTGVQDYLGFKDAVNQKLYFMENSEAEKSAFYAGAVQSFRCHF